jgi:hypothetical protein
MDRKRISGSSYGSVLILNIKIKFHYMGLYAVLFYFSGV